MRHLRKFILISGTLLSVLIAVPFVVSWRWQVAFPFPTPYGPYASLRKGSFVAVRDNPYLGLVLVEGAQAPYWPGSTRHIELPLYILLLAAALPTLLVWWFWPKPPKPGHCRCGYDLTGNTSGVCPECGAEVSRRAGAS
jgi:hypothetical protein